MTKRTRTIALIAVLVPLMLVVAGALALKLFFTGDRLKAMLIPRMEEATGRTVAIGEIGLSVFPSLAIDIDSLALSNRPGKGFSSTPFLSLDRLRLNVSLFGLLGGRVEVTSLLLERPRLLLEVNKENLSNYSDLGTPSPGEDEAAPGDGSAAALALFVSEFQVENGVLVYLNHRTDAATSFRAVRIEAGLESVEGHFVMEGQASADSVSYGSLSTPLIEGIRSTLGFQMTYEPRADSLTFDRGELTVQQIPLTLSGTVAGLRSATVLDVSIGSDDVSIPDLFSFLPRSPEKNTAEMSGTGRASIRIDITGVLTDSTEAETRGRITVRDASLQYAGLARPITEITVLAGFTRTRKVQEFRIDTLTARMGEDPIALSMRLTNFDDPRLSLSASGALNLAQIGDFYPLEQGTHLAGTVQAKVRVLGAVRDPKQLRAAGTMELTGVSIATAKTPSPLRDLTGSVTFNNQVLEARRLSFLLGKSDLSVGFRLNNYLSLVLEENDGPRASASVALQSTVLRSEDFMRQDEPAVGPAAQRSEGKQSGLPLPDVPLDMTVTIGSLSADKFQFRNVRGALGVADGILTLKNLTLGVFGGTVTSAGSLNLRDRTHPAFDLKLDMRALRGGELLTPFTSFGQRLGGTLSMETSLAGILNDTLGIVPSSLNGSGTVAIVDGSLKGFRVNEVVASTFNLPDLQTVNFRNWKNSFTVRDGRLQLKDLVVKALNAEYVVNGSHGLDGTIDYRMALYLPPETAANVNIPGFAGQAIDLFKDDTGRLRFDIDVTGTTIAPTLRLDTESAKKKAEQMADEKLKQEMQKLENTVKEKAEGILKKLFKPPPR